MAALTRPLLVVRAYGIPRPQGSLQPYGTVNGKTRFAHRDTLLSWRADVVEAAKAALPEGWEIIETGVAIRLSFIFARPQRHFDARTGELRPDAPHYMSSGTDLDKLVRAIFDALTVAHVWDDDKRASIERSEKVYADPGETPGCRIEIWTL